MALLVFAHFLEIARIVWIIAFLARSLHRLQFFLRVLTYELFDDDVAAANPNDESTIKNFRKNLARAKQVVAITQLLDGHWTSC